MIWLRLSSKNGSLTLPPKKLSERERGGGEELCIYVKLHKSEEGGSVPEFGQKIGNFYIFMHRLTPTSKRDRRCFRRNRNKFLSISTKLVSMHFVQLIYPNLYIILGIVERR